MMGECEEEPGRGAGLEAGAQAGEGRTCLQARRSGGTAGVHFDFDRAGDVFGAEWGRTGVGVWEVVEGW